MAVRSRFPDTGIRAVIKNQAQFMRGIQGMLAGINGVGAAAAKNAAAVAAVGTAATGASVGAHALALGMAALKIALLGVVAVLATVVIGIGSLFALSLRAAPFSGIVSGFDNIARSAGIASDVLLIDLRRAAAGTVSDMQLMRNANLALAGAAGEFATKFGTALPRILEVARTQARVTGLSVEYLFNSLITGVKRAEPRLIDNTGIIIKVRNVYEEYAQNLGIAVTQMTLFDRQMAILNATLAAGEIAIAAAGDAQETAAEKTQRFEAGIKNLIDTIGLALQPGLMAILDTINQLVGALVGFIREATPYIAAISQLFGEMLTPVRDAIGSFARFLGNPKIVQSMFTGGARMIGALAGGIAYAANTHVFPVIISIATFIADFLSGMSPPPKGPLSTIDIGGRNVMLAWLAGFAGVSLEPVEQVAAEVNAFLGTIGTMGLNLVERKLLALDRALLPFQERLQIIKGIFESMQEPAKAALEAIERQTLKAVQGLLRGEAGSAQAVRMLDANRESIEKILDANTDIVDQFQIQLGLMQAQQEPERTLLNIQKARLEMMAQLAAATTDAKKATKKTPAGPKEKEETGSGLPDREPGGGGGEALPDEGALDDLLGLGEGQIATARDALVAAFNEGAGGQIKLMGQNLKDLREQFGRIGSATEGGFGGALVRGIVRTGEKIAEEVGKWFVTFDEFFMKVSAIFLRDPEQWYKNLGNQLRNILADFQATRNAIAILGANTVGHGIATVVTLGLTIIDRTIAATTRGFFAIIRPLYPVIDELILLAKRMGLSFMDAAGFILDAFIRLTPQVLREIGILGTAMAAYTGKNLDLTISKVIAFGLSLAMEFGIIWDKFKEASKTAFDPSVENSFGWHWSNILTWLQPIIDKVLTAVKDSFVGPFITAVEGLIDLISLIFTGETTEGLSFPQVMDQFIDLVSDIPQRFGEALEAIDSFLITAFINPIIGAINTVISAFAGFINTIRSGVADLLTTIVQPIMTSEFIKILPNADLIRAGGAALTQLAADLREPISFDTIGLMDIPSPVGTRGARGGLFGPGSMMVGERGPEIISSANKMAVFPNSIVRALSAIAGMQSSASPHVSPGMVNNVTNNYSNDRNINATFNGGGNTSVMHRLSMLGAFT